MSSDLTFITNEEGQSLVNRFSSLIKDTRFFDCLVGYFYTSGFHMLYKSLENTEKIRILIGISTNRETYNLILSSKEVKNEFSNQVIDEMENSEDSIKVEQGVKKFVEWLISKKLEIRAFPSKTIHAKLYIMTFKEGDRDVGRVITGSSNFTKSGLKENIEFNVELKNRSDYDFALKKFNELWDKSVPVSEDYVQTIKNKTWLNDEITPYELYLKFLYEYLKEKINLDKQEIYRDYLPDNFMDLEYQKDAVRDAKMKLEEYGGVFISDVVGLGKTYISAMLAQQLDGRCLIIAPPVLLDEKNPGSWNNVFLDFGVRQSKFVSIGKLDELVKEGTDKYKNVFIDESHRFRTETTQMYENLHKICSGKRVILVSATPLNNTPRDILSQIKLFQNSHKSTLPNPKVKDLERYFNKLQKKLNGLDRSKDKEKYLKIVKENANDIRENVLQYLMVRRTRNNIMKYYKKDLEKQKLKFPEIKEPQPIFYNFDNELDKIFTDTLKLIIKKFKYARYTPLLYLKKELPENKKTPQKNMMKFMKILLLKRLESSFYAFKQSINRFIYSYERFINEFEKGNVYVSKKYINKIFELLENDDIETVEKLIEQGKTKKYSSDDFNPEYINCLKNDLIVLKNIQEMWDRVENDPKLEKFIEILSNDKNLINKKLIVFTESKETAEYIENELNPIFDNKVLSYSSSSGYGVRDKILENFDARAKNQKDDYCILVSTEILSEGVNLHRSNVVINYDIPWNPTRLMQRVGRINRVDSKFDEIYIYNFFPAGQINENISLREAAEAKIKAFIEMLGNDAKLLTDEEIKSHDLFSKLNSKELLVGEDEENDELKYLTYLRNIRDNDKKLFEKIKKLPKKARTSRRYNVNGNYVLTFFRKGKMKKIFKANKFSVEELDFFNAAKILESDVNTKKESLDSEFYELLEKNKKEFDNVYANLESLDIKGSEKRFFKLIRAVQSSKDLTDEEIDYLDEVLKLVREGAISKMTINRIMNKTKRENNIFKIFGIIKNNIPQEDFQRVINDMDNISEKKEIILSEYLIGCN